MARLARLFILQLADVRGYVFGNTFGLRRLNRLAFELIQILVFLRLELIKQFVQALLRGVGQTFVHGIGFLGVNVLRLRGRALRFRALLIRVLRVQKIIQLHRAKYVFLKPRAHILRHGVRIVYGTIAGAAVRIAPVPIRGAHGGIGYFGIIVQITRLPERFLAGRDGKLNGCIREPAKAAIADRRTAARTSCIIGMDGFPALRAKHAYVLLTFAAPRATAHKGIKTHRTILL